jgi:hypothetical protein
LNVQQVASKIGHIFSPENCENDTFARVLLLAHGLLIEMIAKVVHAGLAVNTRLWIMDAGRRALAERQG